MNATTTLKKFGLEQAFRYIYKDPEKNMLKIMDWVDKFADGGFVSQRKTIREIITDPQHPYYSYVRRLFTDVDPNVTRTLAVNFFINAGLIGWPKEESLRKEYNCNIPWAILLDPTSACNLHCTGCWAAEYGNKLNLSYDEIDDIICQGKELGVYLYIYTGGEPLVRKKDLIRLCEKHSDCVFLCFTNIPHGEILVSMINPFMDIDFYTLYSFMHYISIFTIFINMHLPYPLRKTF